MRRVEGGKINEELKPYTYFGVCAVGGMLSAGTTHLAITPLDVLKVNMQVPITLLNLVLYFNKICDLGLYVLYVQFLVCQLTSVKKMIWGVIRRKVASPKVLEESVLRIRHVVSGPRCYWTTRKEALLIGQGFHCVQNTSYHVWLGDLLETLIVPITLLNLVLYFNKICDLGLYVLYVQFLVCNLGIIFKRKPKVLEESVLRIRHVVSGPRCYWTTRKEALLIGQGFHCVQNTSYHVWRPCHSSLRLVTELFQRDPFVRFRNRPFCSGNGDLVEAVVPFMGESITDGTLATFLKQPGDRVKVDEPIAQIETDKVTIDVVSPEAGTIQKFVAKEGDTVEPGTKIAVISKSGEGVTQAPSEKAAVEPPTPEQKQTPDAETAPVKEKIKEVSPSQPKPKGPPPPPKATASEPQLPPKDRERRVPMTRLRKRVASRLKDSQNTFALLSTFNEVDMTNLMKLRSDYKDAFLEKHGVKLGFMSGFVKAAVSALRHQPVVNAVIDGDDIIYRDYIDISIAVGTPKGLVVPVIRNAENMNFAGIEKEINTLAKKANDGSISIDEMAGGTFTISNGGVYGSLLSTPIINPPQSAILGMHSIVNRPMVVEGNIVPRPMMYIALTYDHRLIDGREAVFFLRRIKEVVEDPRRLLLDV
ncbi:Dihydrolipoyllysine-residue succinyltransferase component of 2-oxoglutarate dehydrogenase complex 2, mitochondrial [Morella rubra]|uniref:dihydrolipoyllysine-residue succinyltransferase n=1 Tax=Morella rubra TaxID=262757 RepID=A0A6A1UP62_9ROSI|nr:Dihydrolipoyllysine-residue succinyltransferase component of 2-oxoglutarate dehydrogenase complex 2, mitochondrial [Morella rubra]